MTYEFLPAARNEFDDAVAYYDRQGPALGDEFVNEVERSIGRILQMPQAGSRWVDARAAAAPTGFHTGWFTKCMATSR